MATAIYANFSVQGFAEVFSRQFVDLHPEDQSSLVGIAKEAGKFQILPGESTSFKSDPSLAGIKYVGYIIEKERYDSSIKGWKKVDEFRIMGPKVFGFKDSRIAYGHLYRYRMRSVLKYTYENKTEDLSNLDATYNIEEFKSEEFMRQVENNASILEELGNFVNTGVTAEGKSLYSVALGDYTLTCDGKSVTVSSNKPDYKGGNISINLREDPRILDGTATTTELKLILNDSVMFSAEKSVNSEFVSQYFASNPSKEWAYVSVVDMQPPYYPSYLFVVPDTKQKKMNIYWQLPDDTQRDVVSFSLFKRQKAGENWTKISGFSRDTCFCEDFNVELGRKYIYALTAKDVHGLESYLSSQIQCELNENYDTDGEEKPLVLVSRAGARPDIPNMIIGKKQNFREPLIVKSSLKFKISEKLNEDKIFVIKITSLDNHSSQNLILSCSSQQV